MKAKQAYWPIALVLSILTICLTLSLTFLIWHFRETTVWRDINKLKLDSVLKAKTLKHKKGKK